MLSLPIWGKTSSAPRDRMPVPARPRTWGTTATLTVILAIVGLLALWSGLAALVALQVLRADPAYATSVGVMVGAVGGSMLMGGGLGTAGHASQYFWSGTPTAASGLPAAPGAGSSRSDAPDPADRPPAEAGVWD